MHILTMNFDILKFCGFWRPINWNSGLKFFLYDGYTVFMLISVFAFTLSEGVDLFVSSKNVSDFTNGSFMLLTTIGVCGKTVNLIKRREEIIELTKVLRNDLCKPRNSDEEKIHSECEYDARFNTMWYTALSVTTASTITVRSFIFDIPEHNLPFKGWLPYEYKASQMNFWIAYFHQIIAHGTLAVVNSSYDTFVPGFMMYTCAQMKILKYRIKSLPRILESKSEKLRIENESESDRKKSSLEFQLIAECIKHHVQIYLFADAVNDIFGNVVFLQFLLSSLVLCVSVYEVSSMELFSSECTAILLYLCCMLVQIFFFCYYGGELALQSTEISDAIYETDWSAFEIKTKKTLIMMMMRSLRPTIFSCGNIINVSLASFNGLVKLSYSMYNVLQ